MPAGGRWSIYSVESPIAPQSVVDRALFGTSRHHSFLAIVDEKAERGPTITDELHFVSFNEGDRRGGQRSATRNTGIRIYKGAELASEAFHLGNTPKFTNEVQHRRKVLRWERHTNRSPMKNGV